MFVFLNDEKSKVLSSGCGFDLFVNKFVRCCDITRHSASCSCVEDNFTCMERQDITKVWSEYFFPINLNKNLENLNCLGFSTLHSRSTITRHLGQRRTQIFVLWTTYIGQHTFLAVIDVGNGDFTLRHVNVVVDIVWKETHFCRFKEYSLCWPLKVSCKKICSVYHPIQSLFSIYQNLNKRFSSTKPSCVEKNTLLHHRYTYLQSY